MNNNTNAIVPVPPNVICLIFLKSPWNPISWITRWALPRSRLVIAKSSHVVICAGEYTYEALPSLGVCKRKASVSLKDKTIVKILNINVPNNQAGYDYLETQLGKGYDYLGAFGLVFDPNRNWNDDTNWFCYELAAACLAHSGLDVFSQINHITETPLLAISPSL